MSDETPAPLSDAEIAEVRQGIVGAQEEMRAYSPIASIKADRFNEVSHFDHLCANMYVFQVVPRLLATLAARDARLAALERANAAMREIVTAVDNNSSHLDSSTREWECPFCFASTPETSLYDNPRSRIPHTAACPVTRARALLATQAPATVEGDPAVCASCGKPAVIHDSGDPYCAQCYHDATGEWPGTTGATAQAGEEGEA